MAQSSVVAPSEPIIPRAEVSPRAHSSAGALAFDWLMAGFGAWLIGGLYLDGWAHIHVPALETFFTPWHAVLYSGYLAGALALVVTFIRNRRRGALRAEALPPGYRPSLVGAFVFFFGGVADMLWHVTFGIEKGVEGLISPSHLVLALGGGLMVTGPLRAGLRAPSRSGWPMVTSLIVFLSLLTFFTEYASPHASTWVSEAPRTGSQAYLSAGFAGFLVQPVILMGLALYVLRQRPLPRGAFTAILSVNAALMTIIHDRYLDTGPYPLIGAAVVAGLVADGLVWRLRPAPDRLGAIRIVAFAVPAVQYLVYMLAVMVWGRVAWSVHLWTGAIVIAGGMGWLLSYLVFPPAPPAASRLGDLAAPR
jgi:hypothetical protein